MYWDFSTFRQAGLHILLLFWGFSIFTGIAAQFLDAIPPASLLSYLLSLVGIGGLIVYAHVAMGWRIPRAWFFILTGAATIFALSNFSGDANKFALVCLASMIVCTCLAFALLVTERRLIASTARIRERPNPKE